MKKMSKLNMATWACHIITFVILLTVYPQLPDKIPSHWGINGQINGYSGKSMIFILYVVCFGCTFMFDIAKKIDPKSENYNKFTRPYEIFKFVFVVFMNGIILATVYASFKPQVSMASFILLGVGLMFAVAGNYMPKFKQNYTMGFKTPWTLASETVWDKTHRMAGVLWVIGGLVIAVLGFIPGPGKFSGFVMMIVVFAITFVPYGYSYFEYKKEQKNKDGE